MTRNNMLRSIAIIALLVCVCMCCCSAGAQETATTLVDDGNNSAGATITTTTELTNATTNIPLRVPPPQVQLNKCCHYGEYLDDTQTCVAGSSEHWVPLIYLINRRVTYTKGEAPKFMHFEENKRPVINRTEDDNGEGCSLADLELFSGTDKLIIFSNGSLFLRERAMLVEPRNYCVDRDAALVCFTNAEHKQSALPALKLHKCCGPNGNYDSNAKKCSFKPLTDNSNYHKLHLPNINESAYQTIYGFPVCPANSSSSYAIVAEWRDAQLNISTGVLQLPFQHLNSSEYCLEHINDGAAANALKIFACFHHFSHDGKVRSTDASVASRLQAAALHIGLVVSVIFLAATLLAGYLMPSVHHVLHWRCQIYYVFCLFVGKLLLAFSVLSNDTLYGSSACLVVASAMHFFFLSAFFWLNTMCFNIWWTFRDFRPSSLERNQELLRLRLYSAYAWGIPLLICAIAVFIDQLPDTTLIRPDFGVKHCWFDNEHFAIFPYFFAPIGILLCANIMLFLSTTHQLTCGLWKRDDVKSSTEKTALGKVCLKLVVVMGVTWIADIISELIGGPSYRWFFTDLINALQGVFIFIVVGCQPQVWSACKRVCCPRSRQEITNTTNGGQHSSSSQGLPSMAACGAEITQNASVATTVTTATTPPSIVNQTKKIPLETVC